MLTKDKVLIKVSSMPGDWDTCSDPGSTREITMQKPAADKPKQAQGGELEYEALTLTRLWEEDRDRGILRQWNARPDFYDGSQVGLTNLAGDGVPLGPPDVYYGVVQSVKRTGSDTLSSDQVKLEVVFAIHGQAA